MQQIFILRGLKHLQQNTPFRVFQEKTLILSVLNYFQTILPTEIFDKVCAAAFATLICDFSELSSVWIKDFIFLPLKQQIYKSLICFLKFYAQDKFESESTHSILADVSSLLRLLTKISIMLYFGLSIMVCKYFGFHDIQEINLNAFC